MASTGTTPPPNTPTQVGLQRAHEELHDALVSTLQAEFGELYNNHAFTTSKLTELESGLTEALTELSFVKQQLANTSPLAASQLPKPVLPLPPKLRDLSGFSVWVHQMRGKMEVDGAAIGSGKAQFLYVYSYLKPKLQQIVLPLVEYAEDSEAWDYTMIFDKLAEAHNHPEVHRWVEELQHQEHRNPEYSMEGPVPAANTAAGSGLHGGLSISNYLDMMDLLERKRQQGWTITMENPVTDN
ncbi:hypothetical protein GGS26DRAFT_80795 [Hypomontagnella submonticulosa]|nr:hypothetical protein GGS26DRAFT_80795 [Hypomontagnella submonticulosa]